MDERIVSELVSDLAPTGQDKPLSIGSFKGPEKVATLTPIRCRKIAPLYLHNNSSKAWNNIETSFEVLNNDTNNKKYSSSSDDEKSGLLSSSSDNDSSCTSTDLTEEKKPTCTYIDVPEKSSKCDQLPFLSSINTKCQSIDDESVSLEIKNTKRQIKTKKPLFRFLCPPYFILAASILEISIYFWGGTKLENILVYSPHRRQDVWRFLSYMLLHSGGIHLTLNIIIQTLLATLLELEQGSWRCAVVYLGGGVAGALGASVLQPTLYMVGASAGVYALLMSHLANVILHFSQMKYRLFRIFSVAVLAASDIAFSVAHWWTADSRAPRIGWAAHCAGAAVGAALGILVYSGCDEDKSHIKLMRWISFLLIILGVTTSVICNIFFIKIS